jgi:CheY-like chemotaxis protein
MQMPQVEERVIRKPPTEKTELDPAPLCVLVADDDSDMLQEVTRALRADGYAVVPVSSGEELIDYLGRCAVFGGRFLVPDVVVSDIRMPGYSGLEVLTALGHTQCDIPTILMTAFGDPDTHEKARRLGAIATFDKPFDADDLSTAVLWACNSRAHLSSGPPGWQRRRRQSRLGYGEGLRERDCEGAEHGHPGSARNEGERTQILNVVHLPPRRGKRQA